MSSLFHHLPYRDCVGMMLLNAAGKVFVGQRIDNVVEAWQMPQGGIDDGELPLDAAHRELWEETGVRGVELLAQLEGWLEYDLPEALVPQLWGGKYRGQRQKWFAFRLNGDDSLININTQTPEFRAWQWAEMDQLLTLIVPFKRELYAKVIEGFTPLLTQR